MSEEEKQAIEYLKFYIEIDTMYEDIHYTQIRILLNSLEEERKKIEELQKDIKEAKEINQKLKGLLEQI